MISRSQKELAKTEIEKIAETYHNWRSKEWETEYKDVVKPGSGCNYSKLSANRGAGK